MSGVRKINIIFLITVLFSIVGSFLNNWIAGYTDNYFVLLLLSQVILALPSILYLVFSKADIGKALRFRKIQGSTFLLLIFFTYLILPLMTFINSISMIFVENSTVGFMENVVSNNGFFLSLFMIAFIPCVLEETVYRGIFYNEYRKISPLKGIFLSAFLFGIMHMNFNQFSYAFVMGIIFALVIEATDSILSTMIMHFIINGNSVILMYLIPKLMRFVQDAYGLEGVESLDSMQASVDMDFSYVIRTFGIPALISTLLALVVYRIIAKKSGRWDFVKSIFRRGNKIEENPLEDLESLVLVDGHRKEKLLSISLIIGIVICIGLMIMTEVINK